MPKRQPNIVIFAIDSIRRDHMSCYGYPRLTTPHLDQLAAEGHPDRERVQRRTYPRRPRIRASSPAATSSRPRWCR